MKRKVDNKGHEMYPNPNNLFLKEAKTLTPNLTNSTNPYIKNGGLH